MKTVLLGRGRNLQEVAPIHSDIDILSHAGLARISFKYLEKDSHVAHYAVRQTSFRQGRVQTIRFLEKLFHVYIVGRDGNHSHLIFAQSSAAAFAVLQWIATVSSTRIAYPPASVTTTGAPCSRDASNTNRSRLFNPAIESDNPPS